MHAVSGMQLLFVMYYDDVFSRLTCVPSFLLHMLLLFEGVVVLA